jgi:hypothetical protein
MASVARAWTFASIAVAICHWRSLSLDQVQNLSESVREKVHLHCFTHPCNLKLATNIN